MLRHKLIRAETKVEDAERGLVRAVVSTEAKDRDNDIIRQEDWDLDAFQRHPVLLSSHSYGKLTNQIGEWTEMAVRRARDGKGLDDAGGEPVLEGLARYYIGEGNPEADWGFKLAEKGMAAYSVGFIPDMSKAVKLGKGDEWGGFEFKGQELLEASQVTIPSNRDGLQRMKGFEDLHPVVASLVAESLEQEEAEQMPADELKALILRVEQRLVDLQADVAELKAQPDPIPIVAPAAKPEPFNISEEVKKSLTEAINGR